MKSNEQTKTEHLSFRMHSENDSETLSKVRNYKDYGYDSQSDLLRDATIQFFENDSNKNSLKSRIEYQKYLKLCLENWETLKSKGHIFEEAKAIITGQQMLTAPTLETVIAQPIPENKSAGLDEIGFCSTCGHLHYGTEPRKCKDPNCLCGVRG